MGNLNGSRSTVQLGRGQSSDGRLDWCKDHQTLSWAGPETEK